MSKKLTSFFFLSFLIFAGHNSFAESQKKHRRQDRYTIENGHRCLCHESRLFTSLQTFVGPSFTVNYRGAEMAMARFLNPNICSFHKAYLTNAEVAEIKRIKNFPNYFNGCFENNPDLIFHSGFNLGLRYMWGKAFDGYGLSLRIRRNDIVDLKLKSDSDEYMSRFLKGKGLRSEEIQTIQKVRDTLDSRQNPIRDTKGAFYKLPETLRCAMWSSDVLFEFYHCFLGNLLETEELYRKNFCLVWYSGVGMRINLKTIVSDNVYHTVPKENRKFAEDHLLRVVPITKFGLQALFKSGAFMELGITLQTLRIPGILPMPIPCPSFISKKDDWDKVEALKILSAINPEVNFNFGFDFYSLCVGEKLEEYYDN